MHVLKAFPVLGSDQLRYRMPGDLLEGVSLNHGQSGRVHLGQPPLCIHNLDALGFSLKDGSQICFTVNQFDFGKLLLGDISHRRHPNQSAFVMHHLAANDGRERAAVLAQPGDFIGQFVA